MIDKLSALVDLTRQCAAGIAVDPAKLGMFLPSDDGNDLYILVPGETGFRSLNAIMDGADGPEGMLRLLTSFFPNMATSTKMAIASFAGMMKGPQ